MSALKAKAVHSGGTWTQERYVPAIMIGKEVVWVGNGIDYDRNGAISTSKQEARKEALTTAETKLAELVRFMLAAAGNG